MKVGEPIRVLFPYADTDALGGSHISSLKLAAGLDGNGCSPKVLLHGPPAALSRHLDAMGLDYERLERPGVLAGRLKRRRGDQSVSGYLFRTIPVLTKLLRREAIDIVHTNDGSMHANWALPAKLAGAQHVWHHRQLPDARGANYLAPLVANCILSVSKFAQPAHPIRDITRRLEVVRSPFNLPVELPDRSECRAALLAEIGAPSDALLLGFFGALSPRKRPDHFVKVVREVCSAMPRRPVHGLIFGREEIAETSLRDASRALAERLGISKHLHMMGHRSPAEPFMAAVDVMIVTALNEPFGRTLIEAMNLRTPVVATRHGGNPEAIVDGVSGFLVDPHRPEAFLPPIERLVSNPEERLSITEEAARFAAGLSTEAHVARVTAIYEELMEQRLYGKNASNRQARPGHASTAEQRPGAR